MTHDSVSSYTCGLRRSRTLSAASLLLASGFALVAQAADFTLIGDHPQASTFRTTQRQIVGLTGFQGKIFCGYGDESRQSGGFKAIYYDLAAGKYVDPGIAFNVEGCDNYDKISYSDGRSELWATGTDMGDVAGGGLVRITSGIAGTQYSIKNYEEHMDSIAIYRDQIYVTGAGGLYRHTANTNTFTRITVTDGPDSARSGRVHLAFELNGLFYAQRARMSDDPNPLPSKIFDGSTWRDGPSLLPAGTWTGNKPLPVTGGVIYGNYFRGSTLSTPIWFFNGSSATQVIDPATNAAMSVIDYTTGDDGWTYVLDKNYQVRVSTDLVRWTTLATAPSDAFSLASHAGYLVVGTKTGGLYRRKQAPINVRIINRWTGERLHDGGANAGYGFRSDSTASWKVVNVVTASGTTWKWFVNAGTGDMLHIEALQDWVQCDVKPDGRWSSMWRLSVGENPWAYILNRWQGGNGLHIEQKRGYPQHKGV